MDIKQLSTTIIEWGLSLAVQDIYLLPKKDQVQVFTRKGGQRFLFKTLDELEGEKLILHFKFIGGMDVGEKRKAQVGAVTYVVKQQQCRLRLSTVGDFRQRESLVIRFLHHFGQTPENYFLPKQLAHIKKKILIKEAYTYFVDRLVLGKQP